MKPTRSATLNKTNQLRNNHQQSSTLTPKNKSQMKQIKQYQDKMAILNQINYKKPLVEKCGDRYFQYILRNRYEEDLKVPHYIYQIKDKMTENKVISKLRSKNSFIKNINPILLNESKWYSMEEKSTDRPLNTEIYSFFLFFEYFL